MKWSQVKLYTSTEALDIVTGLVISHGIRGVMVEDAADFSEFLEDTRVHWDYIDEALLEKQQCETAVVFYLPDTLQGIETLRAVQSAVPVLPRDNPGIAFGRLAFELDEVEEEDWSTAWKKYYHPVRVGRRLLICPCWEECAPEENEVRITLDPGMAFGTGTHETTRLCMEFLEDLVTPDSTILDIGTGSGILAVTALLLGAKEAVGVDIDALAVKVAGENAALNGVSDALTLCCGDLTEEVQGTFDVLCANIVADVILRLCATVTRFMHARSVLVVSGIIEDRAGEVAQALEDAGLRVTGKKQENDWVSMTLVLQETQEERL